MAVACVVALVAIFGAIQLASDAFTTGTAAEGALPARISLAYGLTVYRWLDRVAPAPYVEITLAQAALAAGDTAAAQRYAVRLPASSWRDELLGRIAAARGEPVLAQEYFLAAPDPGAVGQAADALARRDPVAAYVLEARLKERLARGGRRPDAAAEASWELGRLANRVAWRQTPGSAAQRTWLERALQNFDEAVSLAPLSERYLVEAANQANLLGDRAQAQALFQRSVDLDPSSADGLGGLGVIAFQNGDRRMAMEYLSRARAIDSDSRMVRALERDLGIRQ